MTIVDDLLSVISAVDEAHIGPPPWAPRGTLHGLQVVQCQRYRALPPAL